MKKSKAVTGMKGMLACVLALSLVAMSVLPYGTAFAEDNTTVTPFDSSQEGQGIHRLYNPNSGEHLYTASDIERDSIVAAGWTDEGIGWSAPTVSSAPVYRLYSGAEHHFTMSEIERDYLVAAGWSDEGIGWYSDDQQGVPLYRLYNSDVAVSPHLFTADANEHDVLVDNGWTDEGIAWYGTKRSASAGNGVPAEGGTSSGGVFTGGGSESGGSQVAGGSASGNIPEGITYKPGVIVLDYPEVFNYDTDNATAQIRDDVDVSIGDTVIVKPGWVDDEYTGGAITISNISSTSPRTISGTSSEVIDHVESINTENDSTRMVGFIPYSGESSSNLPGNPIEPFSVNKATGNNNVFSSVIGDFKLNGSWDISSSTINFQITSLASDINASGGDATANDKRANNKKPEDETQGLALAVEGSVRLDLQPYFFWPRSFLF